MKLLYALKKGYAEYPQITRGVTFPTMLGGIAQLAGSSHDYKTEAGLIYDNSVVAMALHWLTDALTEAPLVLQERRPDSTWSNCTTPAGDELLATIEQPNNYYDLQALIFGYMVSANIVGQAFWIKRRDKLGRVIGFWYAPHYQMLPRADGTAANPQDGTKLVTHYWFRPIADTYYEIPVEDVVAFQQGIDPLNPARGFGRLAAPLREICTDNEATTYMSSLLRNMGLPGVIFIPKFDPGKAPTADQIKSFKDLWLQFTRDGRGRSMLSPMPMEVASPQMTPEDLRLDKMANGPVTRICASMNLDPMVLKLPSESKTYSNFGEAREAAYEEAVKPAGARICAALKKQLFDDFKIDRTRYRLSWDWTQVRALQEDENARHERIRDNWESGLIKRSEGREQLGLKTGTEDEIYRTDIKKAKDGKTPKDELTDDPIDTEKQ